MKTKESQRPMDSINRKLADVAKVDRDRAIEIGSPYYWTGKPCSRGHKSFRYVSDYNCVMCGSQYSKAQQDRKQNPDKESIIEKRKRAMDVLADIEDARDPFDYLDE